MEEISEGKVLPNIYIVSKMNCGSYFEQINDTEVNDIFQPANDKQEVILSSEH